MSIVIILLIIIIIILLFGRDGFENVIVFLVKASALLILIGIVTGIGLLMASTLTFFIVGVVAMIIVGFSETGRWSLGQALMMEHAGEEYRARVISLLMMTWGLMPLSMLPMGWAFGYFGAEITTFLTVPPKCIEAFS